MACSLRYERELLEQGVGTVAGIDEAGRGPLAGPVVAAAVILPPEFEHPVLTDSKKLTATVRDALYEELTSASPGTGIRWASAIVEAPEIDELNILRATHEAMRRAVAALPGPAPLHVLIDGLPGHPFPLPQTAIVKGDSQSYSIAAASIIAKVTRDRIMLAMDTLYPQYGFARHKGYGTADHRAALAAHGPTPIHRRSFTLRPAQLDLF